RVDRPLEAPETLGETGVDEQKLHDWMSLRNSVAMFGPATAESAWYTSSMKKRKESPGALQGLLGVDFARVLAGPLCTQLLSDAGARLIKIEQPRLGDETRRWGPP